MRAHVRDELMPLEQEFMASPKQAYGLPEIMMIRRVFSGKVAERLVKVSRETGLWYLMVPEGSGTVSARTGCAGAGEKGHRCATAPAAHPLRDGARRCDPVAGAGIFDALSVGIHVQSAHPKKDP